MTMNNKCNVTFLVNIVIAEVQYLFNCLITCRFVSLLILLHKYVFCFMTLTDIVCIT